MVVDMQNTFVASGGLSEIETASGIVPNINRLAGAVRQSGGCVVWIRSSMSTEGRSAWKLFFDNFVTDDEREARRASLSAGN